MTDTRPILSVRNLKTYFRQDEGVVKAVDGASFDLYAGKTLGIVGESGCGKSVTARSVLQIIDKGGSIEGGEIWLNGLDADGEEEQIDLATLEPNGKQMRSIRGDQIALIFQEPMTSFSAFHTVGNQIIEAIRQHDKRIKKKEAREKAIGLLRQVGIPHPERRVDDYAFQLSGGLRQRVMIAMALSSEPNILIADEPTTALDVTTQAQVLELLRSIQEERDLAIILITHDMGVIAEMADDVVVMYLGRVVEEAPVDDIFHASQHPYTRSLLQSIPSILAAPRTVLSTIRGAIPHPYNRPSGCAFYPRCPDYMPNICNKAEPELLDRGDGQRVSCFLYEDEGSHVKTQSDRQGRTSSDATRQGSDLP